MNCPISVALIVAAAAVAAPAAAQFPRPDYGYGEVRGGGVESELAQVQQRIRMAVQRRLISRDEGDRLSRAADRIEDRLRHNGRDGLSFGEREDVQRRINALRDRLRFEHMDERHRDW